MYLQEIQEKEKIHILRLRVDKRSPATIKKYKIVFHNFNNFLEKHNIKSINAENVSDILTLHFKQHLQQQKTTHHKSLTDNTINQYMILIKNFLVNECGFNIKKYKQLKTKKPAPKYISVKQYKEIINHLEEQEATATNHDKKKIYATDQAIINLLFTTGLRIHEALKLTIKEITKAPADHNGKRQIYIIGKGDKGRDIIITKKTFNLLLQYINNYAESGDIYIFQSHKPGHQDTAKPTTTRTIERHFQRIARELDKQSGTSPTDATSYTTILKPHSLRHSYAVTGLSNGMSINAVQEALGHSNITTTQIYSKLNANSLSDAVTRAAVFDDL